MPSLPLLPEPQAIQLLADYGIPYPEHDVAQTPKEAVRIADRLGYPIVLKVVSADIVHKSDVGGVVVGVRDGSEIPIALTKMVKRIQSTVPGACIDGFLVCRMAEPGEEVIIGGLDDAIFGPAIMFGLGGIFAEILKDVVFRIAPLDRREALEMIESVRGYAVLKGTRGRPACDVETLAQTLVAVSHVMLDDSDIQELDLNPVRVFDRGLQALDIRIMLKNRED